MPSRLSKMITRLVSLIAAILSMRGLRRQTPKLPPPLTPRPARPVRQPRRFIGRKSTPPVPDIQEVSLLIGDESRLESAEANTAPAPEISAPPTPADVEREQRQRTMPFRVADIAGFTLTAESAFEHKYNNVMLTVQGRVVKRLPTDTIGNRHQKFVITLTSGQSLLINHNISDAPRVPIRMGDEIEVRGRYIWNEQGGEMHWTHHDPNGKVAGGYIQLYRTGKKYE